MFNCLPTKINASVPVSVKKFNYFFLVALFLFLGLKQSSATNFFTRVSGVSWNAGASWSTISCGGTAGISVPSSSGDAVTICSGHTITATSASTGQLTMQGGTLVIPSGVNLNCTDVIGTSGTINMTGGSLTISSGNFTYTGTFTQGTGTVIFSGGAQNVQARTFNNLTCTGIGLKTMTGAVTVGGVLSLINSTNALVVGANTLTLNGSVSQSTGGGSNGVITLASSATFSSLTLGGTTAVSDLGSWLSNASGYTIATLAVTNTGGVTMGSKNMTIATAFNFSGTTTVFAVGTNSLTISGTTSQSSPATITSSTTGTVNYNSASAQTVCSGTYGNLIISNTAKTFSSIAAGINISGTFTPGTATTHTVSGSTIAFTGTGQTIPGFNGTTGYGILKVNLPFSSSTIGLGSGVIAGSSTTSGVLLLTQGVIDNTGGNTLTVGSTATNAITIGSGYLTGALALTIPSTASNATYIWPVGNSISAYRPFELVGLTTSGSAGTITAECVNTSTGGSAGPGLASISSVRYWKASVATVTIATATVRLTEGSLSSTSRIGQSSSSTVASTYYALTNNTTPGTTIQSTTAFNYGLNNFVIGTAGGSSLCGTKTVGTGGDFTTLTQVANALNSATLSCDLLVELQTSYVGTSGEGFPMVFNQWTNSGGPWKVTIRPASGVSSTLTTSGDPGSTNDLITFNGVSRLIFDGVPGGHTGSSVVSSSRWTISNTRTTSTIGNVINIIGTASANSATDSIQFLTISGAAANTASIVQFGAASVSGGNSSNYIGYNTLTSLASNFPAYGVYAAGSSSFPNISNKIVNNEINNYSAAGINITNATACGSGWTISNNSIYKSNATPNPTAGIIVATLQTGIGGHTITGNFIGGQSASAGGSALATSGQYIGMDIGQNTSGSVSTITGNTVTNISCTNATAFTGIRVGGSFSSGQFNCGNGSGTGNTVSSIAANSLTIKGIEITSTDATLTDNNSVNTITQTNAGSAFLYGIYSSVVFSGVSITVSNNTIQNLTNVSTGGLHTIAGIQFSSSTNGTNAVKRNVIKGLYSASTLTTPIIYGINTTAGTTTYSNNMIALGLIPSSGSSMAVAYTIIGISDASTNANPNKYYYNSVYIGGSGVATTATNTYAFKRTATTSSNGSDDIEGNIFYNGRANNTTGGVHFAIGLNSSSVVTSNYNLLYAPNTGGAIGQFVAATKSTMGAWQGSFSPSPDAASVSGNPNFTAISGTVGSLDLHIVTAACAQSAAESGASTSIAIVDDIDAINTRLSGSYPKTGQSCGFGTAPDIGADEGDFGLLDVTGPGISYTPLAGTTSTSSRTLGSVTITDASGVNTTTGTAPRIYYKLSTETNQIVGNTLSDNGWKYVEGTFSSGTWSFSINYSLLTSTPTLGSVIQYFVVAQDLVGTPNVGINAGVFSATPSNVTLTTAQLPTGFNTYTIFTGVNAAYYVGPSSCSGNAATQTTFTTASTGFFAAVMNTLNGTTNVMNRNVTVYVTGSITEPGSVSLNQWVEDGNGPYTLTIVPCDATVKTLSSSATTLFTLNGADHVVIDGRVGRTGSTSSLAFSSTSSTGSALALQSDAQYDTIAYCALSGRNGSSAVIQFLNAASGGTGNSYNVIDHNTISSNLANNLDQVINSVNSTASTFNSYNYITNNNIADGLERGIAIGSTGNGNGWVISGNSIYNTVTNTTNLAQLFIQFTPGTSSASDTISGNYLGGSGPLCSGTSTMNQVQTYEGIRATVSSDASHPLIISGNTITNINATNGAFYCINIDNTPASSAVNITNNTIGSGTTATVIQGANTGGGVEGIVTQTSGALNIIGNTIGGLFANGTGSIAYGINAIGGSANILNNTIINIYQASTSASSNCRGINHSPTASGSVIAGNSIRRMGNSAASGTYTFNEADGITVIGTTGNSGSIYNNKCSEFFHTTLNGGWSFGIRVMGAGNWNVYNNMVNMYNKSFASTGTVYTTRKRMMAIMDSTTAGTNNYYYNTAIIQGDAATTASGATDYASYCFLKRPASGNGATVTVKNNVFINNFKTACETNNITICSNYAIGSSVTSGFTSDYNFLSSQETTGFPVGRWSSTDAMTLADWRTTSGQDANSYIGASTGITALATSSSTPTSAATPTGNTTNGTVNPYDLFVDAAGGNLHVTTTPATSPTYAPFNYIGAQGNYAASSSVTTSDYDSTSRANPPCTGADEFVSNPTLVVSGAGTGASPGNGSTTETLNSSVTATSGTQTGKNAYSWTGTGSVVSGVSTSGTFSTSVTFSITQNSTITWNFVNNDIPVVTAKEGGVTGPTLECSGNVISLTANAVNPTPDSCSGSKEFSWYNGTSYWDGSSFASGTTVFDPSYANITPTISATTTYTVTVRCSSNTSSTGSSSITVNVISTSPSSLVAAIGSPANGINHHMTVTWGNATGATGGYDLQRSISGGSYSTIATGTTSNTGYDDATGDNPNAAISYRIKVHSASGNCSYVTLSTPVYTACDTPATPTISGPQPTSLNVTINAETPVANPSSTQYSIFCSTTSQYVQADGSLGATEAFNTKSGWGTITVTPLTANTTYCFYVRAKNGDGNIVSGSAHSACGTSCTPPTVSITPSSATVCNGTPQTLTASGATTYVWSDGETTTAISVTPSATITYTVVGTTSGACNSNATVTVTVNPLPTVTATSSGTNVCTSDNVTLTASGAISYTWSPSTYLGSTSGSPVTSTPTSAGAITYTVTGTDGNSCSSTATVSFTAYSRPTPLSGIVTVGSGGTYNFFNGSGQLFDDINTKGVSGTLTVQVISDITETTSTPLTTVVTCGGGGGVLIQPDGTTLRTVSGNVSGGLLIFSGASNVTIDGRNGGSGSGQYLKFAVGNSSSSDMVFQNSATNITVEYCLLDISTSSNTGSFINFSTSSSGTTGNSYITIDHNSIGSANWIANNIYSLGTGGTPNHDNTITNNDIYNFQVSGGGASTRSAGISVTSTGNGGNWTIKGNSLFQTAANSQNVTTAIDFSAGSSSNNNIISSNYIGGSGTGAAACSGCGINYMDFTYTNTTTQEQYNGININAGSGNKVNSNTIRRIYVEDGYWSGYVPVFVQGSTVATVDSNIFGGTYPADFTTSATNADMIEVNGGGGSTYAGYIFGILDQSSGTLNADYNTFNYLIQNGSGSAGGQVINIFVNGSGAAILTNNDMTPVHQEAWGESYNSYGIYMFPTASTSGNRIENNKIGCVMITGASINQVSTDGMMVDINAGLTVSGTIKNNQIFDNSTVENSGVIEGIYITTANNGNSSSNGNWDIYNNMIYLNNTGQTLIRTEIDGIDVQMNSSSTTNIFYNTVWISGTNRSNTSTLANPSSCLLIIPGASGASGTMTVKNNVLLNNRVGGSPNSDTYHVAMWHSSTSTSGWTSDYNIYGTKYVSSSSFQYGRMAVWGTNSMFNLATLQGFDGTDAHSYRPNTDFLGTTSAFSGNNLYVPSLFNQSTSTADLSINQSDGQSYKFVDARGNPVSVTVDYQGDTRNSSTPDLGADEITPCTVSASIGSSTNVSCNGGSNGAATVTASGSSSLTYSWAPSGGSTSSATGLTAGTYTVTVTTSGSSGTCAATASVTITQPSALAASASKTDVGCNGGSTGTATSTTSGGTLPYSYSWSTGSTNSSITGLTAGTYTLTVTDACSATSSVTATVSQPSAALSASITAHTDVACFGQSTGSASVTASGGTSPYSYSWTNSSGTTSSVSGLSAGSYTVTVTDSHSCTTTTTGSISQPSSALQASASHTDASCNGGSNGLAGSTSSGGTGSYTYLWSTGATTSGITGLSSSTYTLTVTDANSCTSVTTVSLGEPSALSAGASNLSNVSCNGAANGSVRSTATGGSSPYSYSWSSSATTSTVTGLSGGTYTVTVTDAHSCTAIGTAIVTEPTAVSAGATTLLNVSCNGGTNGSVTASGSGGSGSGYTYLWSSGQTTSAVTGRSAGTYTVTVTDGASCKGTGTATVTEPSALSASAGHSDVTCAGNDGTATSTTSGGTTPYTYAWSNGSTLSAITALSAGTYTLTVTDTHSCTSTTSATVGAAGGCGLTYTVKVFLQGYYLGSGNMSPLLKLLNASSSATAVDTVTIELHASGTTANYTYTGILQSNGNIVCSFSSAAAGSYYVVVKHRNSLTTYSASAQTISDGGSYDFTTGAGQAYGGGNRMANLGDGSYAIYGGDVNVDGSINTSDKTALQSALSSFTIGTYDVHDITGDGFVDEDDYRIIENNAPLSLTVQHP